MRRLRWMLEDRRMARSEARFLRRGRQRVWPTVLTTAVLACLAVVVAGQLTATGARPLLVDGPVSTTTTTSPDPSAEPLAPSTGTEEPTPPAATPDTGSVTVDAPVTPTADEPPATTAPPEPAVEEPTQGSTGNGNGQGSGNGQGNGNGAGPPANPGNGGTPPGKAK